MTTLAEALEQWNRGTLIQIYFEAKNIQNRH
jgi:hypothetical protein